MIPRFGSEVKHDMFTRGHMQKFELTTEEAEVLRDILQHNLNELDVEVFRTDTHDFKEMLRHRRDVIERILGRLAVPAAAR
jgi:hypothetical protein